VPRWLQRRNCTPYCDPGYQSAYYTTWEKYVNNNDDGDYWGFPEAETFPAGSVCYQQTTTLCTAADVAAKWCPSTMLGFAVTTYDAFNSAESSALAQCTAQARLVASSSRVPDAASACVTNNCNQPPASAMRPSGAATAAGTVAALLAASVAALAMM
jgi:hypothetical protein